MNNINWAYYDNEQWVDPIISELNQKLRMIFPEMTEWVLRSNWIFTKFLNTYTLWDINWIPDFLNHKWYEYKWFILFDSENISLKDDAKEKVLNWEYYVWLKYFFEIEKGEMIEKKYLIFAKKKDTAWIDWIKKWIGEFFASFLWPKHQN